MPGKSRRKRELAAGTQPRCSGDALCPKPQLLMIDDTVCSPPLTVMIEGKVGVRFSFFALKIRVVPLRVT